MTQNIPLCNLSLPVDKSFKIGLHPSSFWTGCDSNNLFGLRVQTCKVVFGKQKLNVSIMYALLIISPVCTIAKNCIQCCPLAFYSVPGVKEQWLYLESLLND